MIEVIYTDGGCIGNPGPGAWAFFLPEKEIARSGFFPDTTNNRMEMMAVIKALEFVNSISEATIYLDSRLVHKGSTEWISRWEKNNWKTSAKKPIKNRDLWEQLRALTKGRKIQWQLVPSHAGILYNERCHHLVQEEISKSTSS